MLERPLASSPDPEEPPELAEIRLAILDQVREKSYRSGGRKVFPFDLLRVELRQFHALGHVAVDHQGNLVGLQRQRKSRQSRHSEKPSPHHQATTNQFADVHAVDATAKATGREWDLDL